MRTIRSSSWASRPSSRAVTPIEKPSDHLLKASGLPARFCWDIEPGDKPGPIQTAWNARLGLSVIDGQGVIRYKNALTAELLEKAVTTLLKERGDARGGPITTPRK
jgi:hypothetical protein